MKSVSNYIFTIGNGYHDVRLSPIQAGNMREALSIAKRYRAIPSDKITLVARKRIMIFKKGSWKETDEDWTYV